MCCIMDNYMGRKDPLQFSPQNPEVFTGDPVALLLHTGSEGGGHYQILSFLPLLDNVSKENFTGVPMTSIPKYLLFQRHYDGKGTYQYMPVVKTPFFQN